MYLVAIILSVRLKTKLLQSLLFLRKCDNQFSVPTCYDNKKNSFVFSRTIKSTRKNYKSDLWLQWRSSMKQLQVNEHLVRKFLVISFVLTRNEG